MHFGRRTSHIWQISIDLLTIASCSTLSNQVFSRTRAAAYLAKNMVICFIAAAAAELILFSRVFSSIEWYDCRRCGRRVS